MRRRIVIITMRACGATTPPPTATTSTTPPALQLVGCVCVWRRVMSVVAAASEGSSWVVKDEVLRLPAAFGVREGCFDLGCCAPVCVRSNSRCGCCCWHTSTGGVCARARAVVGGHTHVVDAAQNSSCSALGAALPSLLSACCCAA